MPTVFNKFIFEILWDCVRAYHVLLLMNFVTVIELLEIIWCIPPLNRFLFNHHLLKLYEHAQFYLGVILQEIILT